MSHPPRFTEPPPGFPKPNELCPQNVSSFSSPPPLPPETYSIPAQYLPLIPPVYESNKHPSYPPNSFPYSANPPSVSSTYSSGARPYSHPPPPGTTPYNTPPPMINHLSSPIAPYSRPPPPPSKISYSNPPGTVHSFSHEHSTSRPPNYYHYPPSHSHAYAPVLHAHHPSSYTRPPPPIYPPYTAIGNTIPPKPQTNVSIPKDHSFRYPHSSFTNSRKTNHNSVERSQLLEKWCKNYCETSEEIAKKLSELANEEKECWVRSSPADVYYKRLNANAVEATPRLEALCKVFDEELIQRAAKIREKQPQFVLPTPKRKHRVCKHKCKNLLRN